MLSRHPTTPTNRNRARSRKVRLWFLGTDILRLASQPVDQTKVASLNPTRDDPNCVVCHANVDPIAGCFQSFDEIGRWSDAPEWFPEMFPPGFGSETLPQNLYPKGLQWLAAKVVQDDRFALSQVYNIYRGLSGQEPLVAPSDYADPLYAQKFDSFLAQANTFRGIADRFVAADHNVRTIVKELVMSPYFRAKNAVTLTPAQQARLAEVGMGHLLTPEQLNRKISAVLAIPWGSTQSPVLAPEPRDPADLGGRRLFYGGMDSDEVTKRISEPNGLMAAVAERMATEMSCAAVPYDFARSLDSRVLFKPVTVDGQEYDVLEFEPETPSGLPIDDAATGIKEAIVHLHEHILGERVAIDGPEVEASYQLFVETWREGVDKMAEEGAGSLGDNLPFACQATEDYFTGQAWPDEQHVVEDPKYVMRSWMAVTTYLLSDYMFLYE
jgi:hypothetical protein